MFICATKARFKLQHGDFFFFWLNSECLLRRLRDRCDFPPNQRFVNPTSLGSDEGCGLNGGMWSKPEISTSFESRWGSNVYLNIKHILYINIPFRRSVCFAESGAIKGEKKLWNSPTFSAQRACHSEQHGPDKQQTSRRLHLLRPSASSPYSKVTVFHCSRWGIAVFWLPLVSRLFFFWHRRSSSFPNLSDFLPGWKFRACWYWSVTRAGAERAPVKAWAGSGTLSQPALTSNSLIWDYSDPLFE